MTTTFSSLPIIDLGLLHTPSAPCSDLEKLGQQLHDVFATTGFAYLVNTPLTFSHAEVFGLARGFFAKDEEQKLELSKKTFRDTNTNTYRGYFPPQQGSENLKEGFEIGPSEPPSTSRHIGSQKKTSSKFNLTEGNVWPEGDSTFREKSQRLHDELQAVSARLLSLLATSLAKPADFFSHYLDGSISTLRYLHYPPRKPSNSTSDVSPNELCCSPHTDSGILTLLHQDEIGGLEVLNASGEWIAAPYVPGSIVVNIGDLMAKISGNRFVATMHRVRNSGWGRSRYSVPFFFEPGMDCVVKRIDASGDEEDKGVVYGEHVLDKMSGWVEFQEVEA